jgi:hypothetical protein
MTSWFYSRRLRQKFQQRRPERIARLEFRAFAEVGEQSPPLLKPESGSPRRHCDASGATRPRRFDRQSICSTTEVADGLIIYRALLSVSRLSNEVAWIASSHGESARLDEGRTSFELLPLGEANLRVDKTRGHEDRIAGRAASRLAARSNTS